MYKSQTHSGQMFGAVFQYLCAIDAQETSSLLNQRFDFKYLNAFKKKSDLCIVYTSCMWLRPIPALTCKRWDTPWTGHLCVTRLTERHLQSYSQLQAIWSHLFRRKPMQTRGEHAQSTQKNPTGQQKVTVITTAKYHSLNTEIHYL